MGMNKGLLTMPPTTSPQTQRTAARQQFYEIIKKLKIW
jgi:hypothetical protein